MNDRRQWLLSTSICVMGWVSPALSASSSTLPGSKDLRATLAMSNAMHRPLVLMASLDHCVYCQLVRERHLFPLLQSGQPVVQLDLRNHAEILDPEGQPSSQDALLRRWSVRLAPTLLFLGPGGRELAERLEGVPLPDFYGSYLDERLVQARSRIPHS